MLERNKAVARRIWLEGWNQGNLLVIEEVLGDNFLYHDPTIETPLDQAEFRRVIFRGLAAFPDIRFDVADQVAEGNKVVTRWTSHGTHQGWYKGIPPSGKQVTMSGTATDIINDGKIIERWDLWDPSSILQKQTSDLTDERGQETPSRDLKSMRRQLRETIRMFRQRSQDARRIARQVGSLAGGVSVAAGALAEEIRSFLESPDVQELLPERVQTVVLQAVEGLENVKDRTGSLAENLKGIDKALSKADRAIAGRFSMGGAAAGGVVIAGAGLTAGVLMSVGDFELRIHNQNCPPVDLSGVASEHLKIETSQEIPAKGERVFMLQRGDHIFSYVVGIDSVALKFGAGSELEVVNLDTTLSHLAGTALKDLKQGESITMDEGDQLLLICHTD